MCVTKAFASSTFVDSLQYHLVEVGALDSVYEFFFDCIATKMSLTSMDFSSHDQGFLL